MERNPVVIQLPIVAEDLGFITPDVHALRQGCGFPGMKILQFGFGAEGDHEFLPHNYAKDTVVYTGTHDNNTTVGWWQSLGTTERNAARHYLGAGMDSAPHWTLMRALSQSVARTVVFPFQDVLGLDGSHRMNTPGLAQGCWAWRFDWSDVGHGPANDLCAMTQAHGRLHTPG